MSFIEINGRKIGKDYPPYIIAELSANHNGDLSRALATIDAAKASGVDAIKIQTYTADTMTLDSDRPEFKITGGLWDGYKLYDLYKWAETPFEWHQEIFDYAQKLGITLFSTPFDETAVDLLESLNTPAYKVASFELTDIPLIRYIAKTGKPMIMSTGMGSEKEIAEAVAAAKQAGCKELILLHCISSYPAPLEQANLKQMLAIEEEFEVITGLSDHTLGTTAAIAAVALGACVIEKHFTLSRADKGPDSEFSIEPAELEQLKTETTAAWSALGTKSFKRQAVEEASKAHRRSIYFKRDLAAGHVITKADIQCIRPNLGLEPKYFDELLGKRLKKQVEFASPTSWEHFE